MRILRSYNLDDLVDDPELTALANLAGKLCATPIALVSLVDSESQHFLARDGLESRTTPRNASFCAHAMQFGEVMEVRDATADDRFAGNALVTGEPHIRFYAGQPLISQEGAPLGALCVIDTVPRPEGLNDFQREGLAVLGQAVMRRLRARRALLESRREAKKNERQLRALADSLPDIAWSANSDGKVDYFNRRWHEFTGIAADRSREERRDVIHPDDFAESHALWLEAVAKGSSFEKEYRLRRADGEWRWMLVRAEPVPGEDGRPQRWFGTMTDIDDAHKLSESRELLARELSHRIKNIFAVISGLITLLSRKRPEHREFGEELSSTIRALGRAHDYVRPAGGDRRDSLHGMLGDLFGPYKSADGQRVRVKGDDSPVAARSATPLALVFHELATNSAKYGALSTDDGHVDLSIESQDDKLLLRWEEKGGPPPQGEPSGEGFGSRLVEMSVTGQLGGSWKRSFEPQGLVVELALSKGAVAP
ncbi:PAS domain S-box-containing protein [Altererythrobacter atlanticus]|uniref:histidine kinase n=1 Tax=Croceibacterium atlanticum TaxID=1267766 RepID=A0A0F7KV23_9SPHN|nr:PAS domain-containing protein [Croceibacterium atlanticum]AKH43087.1 Blue-light-activated histidine kinase 1 [Croceibacterium atlanticum]MBB5732209.1 PAS domain S-box-containing protein [Croceibacterium atlanticum]